MLAGLDPTVGPTQEAIVAELRRVLVEGGAPPGSELPLDDIALVFGVSRVPVREALKTLQGERLVEHLPRQGYAVARLAREEYLDLYVARHALESAALKRAVTRASSADIEAIQTVHEELTQTLADGDAAGWHRGSRAFHELLVAPCRMRQLLRLLESTWNITEPVQPMTLVPPEVLTGLQREHGDILAAYRYRNVDRLMQLFELHCRHLLDAVGSLPDDHPVFAPAD